MTANIDSKTVEAFGQEWSRFDQTGATDAELQKVFEQYFSIFPWESLPANAVGFDMGCGSGRWANFVAGRVGKLNCVDASEEALAVAKSKLTHHSNVECIHASVDSLPFEDASMDFGYSLGVLHHIPDTAEGIKSCVQKLKSGAPFLIYLYYAFDNRPAWFRLIWRVSELFRRLVSALPFGIKRLVTDLIALTIYFPLAKIALFAEKGGLRVEALPLSTYRTHSFYTMRTDALDRFGTRLEQRFTREEIKEMMESAGLENVTISSETPYWCAVGVRSNKDLLVAQ